MDLLNYSKQEWKLRAKCASRMENPDDWFDKYDSNRRAEKLCQGCPVIMECLEYALENDERFGIWGGLTARSRRRLARQRRKFVLTMQGLRKEQSPGEIEHPTAS